MEKVTVDKDKLLEVLKTNRAGHRDVFLKAQEGWKATITEEIEHLAENARNGIFVHNRFYFPEPHDHTPEYDRAICMIEMDVGKKVIMSENDFAQYVMDDWGWKAEWTASNVSYVSKASN